jgi:predicted dehydrogenase
MVSDRNMLGIAVFGAGRWGTHMIRNIHQHPNLRLVAIADPDSNQLARAARIIDFDETVVLTQNWEKALQLPQIEAVVVVTPAQTHAQLIRAALHHQYHVLTEKPLALTASEAIDLCHLAEQQQRHLMIDHTYLFHPAVEAGYAYLRQIGLDTIRYGYSARTHMGPIRQDVDALWDLAIHDISIFNYWLGEAPALVQAQGSSWLRPVSQESFSVPRSDVVWVRLAYSSGVHTWIHLCWANSDKQRRVGLVTQRGTLIFDELQADMPLVFQHGKIQSERSQFEPIYGHQEAIAVADDEPLKRLCDRFWQTIQQSCATAPSLGWEGVRLVQILEALSTSLAQGGIPIPLS